MNTGGIIKIANAATLAYIDNQWETQGTFTKTGGTMSWNNVAWTLSDDTSYSSDTAIATKTLTLNTVSYTHLRAHET